MDWEYKIIFLVSDAAADEDAYEERLHANLHVLNDLGRKGWELVAFLPHLNAARQNRYHAVLKRLHQE